MQRCLIKIYEYTAKEKFCHKLICLTKALEPQFQQTNAENSRVLFLCKVETFYPGWKCTQFVSLKRCNKWLSVYLTLWKNVFQFERFKTSYMKTMGFQKHTIQSTQFSINQFCHMVWHYTSTKFFPSEYFPPIRAQFQR